MTDRVGEVFHVTQWAVSDTNQQTEECKWTAKKEQETNYNNLDMCRVTMWEQIIEKKIHTYGSTMGHRRFGLLVGLEILERLQGSYGIPSAQEGDNASARFDPLMNHDDHQKS